MGDLRELDTHDTALKFWLPEPAERALSEFARLQGFSISSMLREFLAIHCYGIYVVQLLRDMDPQVFKDPDIRFSISLPEGRLSGHTFHYSQCETPLSPLVRASKGNGEKGEAIYRQNRLTASYMHFYFPSNPLAVGSLMNPGG